MPLLAMREIFRPAPETIWMVNQRAEMALVRGPLPVLRLHRIFNDAAGAADPLASKPVVVEPKGSDSASGRRVDRQAGGSHQATRRNL
jgi:hypothetical protein